MYYLKSIIDLLQSVTKVFNNHLRITSALFIFK